MEKKKTIILILIIVIILILLGVVLYKYEKKPNQLESIESSSVVPKESLTIESVDYSSLIPINGNIKKHYSGVATNTKTDTINLDMVEVFILDNNEIVVVQSYGEKAVSYYGSYAGSFDNDNVKIIYKPILKGGDCKLSAYSHETIDIYKNTDESIFFEELDANKEIIKLIDDGNTSKEQLDKLSCYNLNSFTE